MGFFSQSKKITESYQHPKYGLLLPDRKANGYIIKDGDVTYIVRANKKGFVDRQAWEYLESVIEMKPKINHHLKEQKDQMIEFAGDLHRDEIQGLIIDEIYISAHNGKNYAFIGLTNPHNNDDGRCWRLECIDNEMLELGFDS